VERVVGEEEVDGVAVPPEPNLAVAFKGVEIDVDLDASGQRPVGTKALTSTSIVARGSA
jgi:hypothetical protein